jgi:hypothetical protein
MTSFDQRIIFFNPRRASAQKVEASATSRLRLTEEQLAFASYHRIKPEELARQLAANIDPNGAAYRRAQRLLKIIDTILAKHYPQVSCNQLYSYDNRAFKIILKKEAGRLMMEHFTSDLIDDLLEAGHENGLKILEGIIAGAVAKLS